MNLTAPTADELSAAYKLARLRWIGVSYQKALTTPCLRISLRNMAIVARAKEQQKDGKPAPIQQAQI
jgi:hypothetical protein